MAARSSGGTSSLRTGAASPDRRSGRLASGSSARTVETKPTFSSPICRNAYASTRDEGPSSHARSSTATISGASSDTIRTADSVPRETASGGGGASPTGIRCRATPRARRWAGGRRSAIPSNHGSRRSARQPNASCASASTARVSIVWQPRPRASARRLRQTVDLPMPAGPVMTRAAGPTATVSRKSAATACSCSRPSMLAASLDRAVVVTCAPLLGRSCASAGPPGRVPDPRARGHAIRTRGAPGGAGEIRTHEGLHPGGFQDRCHQPLGHRSAAHSTRPRGAGRRARVAGSGPCRRFRAGVAGPRRGCRACVGGSWPASPVPARVAGSGLVSPAARLRPRVAGSG